MADIKIEGLEELQKALKKNATLNDLKKVVKQNGVELQQRMVRKASFKKGYQTGTTKRSIHLEIKDGGMTAEVGPETEYSEYLEWGTRFMQKQPFVRPSLEEQEGQFKSGLQKYVK